MPVLNVKKDGVWQDIASSYTHAHTVSDITDLPASLVDDVEALKDKVGADSVAYQITTAIKTNEYVHPYTHPADMITGLSDVAISGDYNDLTNLPEEYVHPEKHDVSIIEGLSAVATSNDYNDLDNKPIIPSIAGLATKTYVDEQIASVGSNGGGISEQVQSDWDETDITSPAYIKNKPVISGGGASVQANWNQTNSIQADFIKNKPFGEFEGLVDILPSTVYDGFRLNSSFGVYAYEIPATYNLIVGDTYIITWDGIEYECVAQDGNSVVPNSVGVGNASAFGLLGNNEPFIILLSNNYLTYASLTDREAGGSHSVHIQANEIVIKKIDSKYLTSPDWEQTDETAGDFIKNKPFGGSDFAEIFSTSFTVTNTESIFEDLSNNTLIVGNTYTVIWNSVNYECECMELLGLPVIGNLDMLIGGDNGIPFLIVCDSNGVSYDNSVWGVIVFDDSAEISFSIFGKNIKCLDNKYLSFMNYVKTAPTELLPLTTYNDFSLNQSFGVYAYEVPATYGLVVDKNYIVTWDEISYECVAQDVSTLIPDAVMIGNASDFGFYGNNEPFIILFANGCMSYASLTDTEAGGSHSVMVSEENDGSYVIKGEYIPEIDSLPPVTSDNNGEILTVVDGTWTVQSPASGLPEVTSDDNDKMLRVIDGAWAVTTIAQELPSITSDDAGKFLRVSADGIWIAEIIPSAEGASF